MHSSVFSTWVVRNVHRYQKHQQYSPCCSSPMSNLQRPRRPLPSSQTHLLFPISSSFNSSSSTSGALCVPRYSHRLTVPTVPTWLRTGQQTAASLKDPGAVCGGARASLRIVPYRICCDSPMENPQNNQVCRKNKADSPIFESQH